MSYEFKTIVVQWDSKDGDATHVKVAACIAARTGAYLIAVNAPASGQIHNEAEKEFDASGRDQLQSIAAAQGVSCEWLPRVADDGSEALAAAGRCADLIVVGQSRAEQGEKDLSQQRVARIVLTAGRPTLMVPKGAMPATIGAHIVVAWSGTRESARAVADALPLLARAKAVTVLAGADSSGVAHGFSSAKASLAYLKRHRIKAQLIDLGRHRFDVGEKILRHCAGCGADLLVMGAYGHSRSRELALGGVTQTVLESMALPVLMSH
jgi:nucleotide-binding universal stress UspA family protein